MNAMIVSINKVENGGVTGPHTAQEVFERFSQRLGWDFEIKADVIANWCGEHMIELLLQQIQDDGQSVYFEEFLIDNFGPIVGDAASASHSDR
jgi:hypothetical protein